MGFTTANEQSLVGDLDSDSASILPCVTRNVPAREDAQQAAWRVGDGESAVTSRHHTDYGSQEHIRQGGCAVGWRGGLGVGRALNLKITRRADASILTLIILLVNMPVYTPAAIGLEIFQ